MPGSPLFRIVAHCFRTTSSVVVDLVRSAILATHSRRALQPGEADRLARILTLEDDSDRHL